MGGEIQPAPNIHEQIRNLQNISKTNIQNAVDNPTYTTNNPSIGNVNEQQQ